MKQVINIPRLALGLMLLIFGCEEYLDIPPEAAITEDQIFGEYLNFQGFQDILLRNIVDYNRHGARASHSVGGEALSPEGQSVDQANRGNYGYIVENRGIYPAAESQLFLGGLYLRFFENIRVANMCLMQLESERETQLTQEQKNWIKGQALFFRGYYYYEIIRGFGSMPYIDEVISSENQNMQRYWTYEKDGKTYRNTQACFERIAEDFQEASTLLPSVWPTPNQNYGRPTSVVCLGFKAKTLQFSASPLFNEEATGSLSYNTELLDRSAQACIETINLAKSIIGRQPEGMPVVNADGLTPWENYRQVFTTSNGVQPGTQEVLFSRPFQVTGPNPVSQSAARSHSIRQLTGQQAASGSQMYLDKFEMSDGSRYSLDYDDDPLRRWDDRDKRFRFTFYVHNDRIDNVTLNLSDAKMKEDDTKNSNAMRKYLDEGVTRTNPKQASYSTPLLRLSDIYLTYAEAVYESTGSYTASALGSSMSAEDAVNIVRRRAGQPDVATVLPFYAGNPLPRSCELSTDSPFRLLYRNERNVELAYEGVYWFDIRRWKRAGLKDGIQIQSLRFDLASGNTNTIDDNSVRREDNQPYVFKNQHYLLPFPVSITRFSLDFPQNPGW
ncbi:RagB/SusD family nutrient uptake outer membrane protein [Polaribacter filamentus]|nr:RagB/SusD family nutrient uptake outer membrane protein [Polaribacter filamentus]